MNTMYGFDYRNVPGLYWTKNTKVGKIKITTEPTPLRVGTENLPMRRQLWVVNDASTFIYHSTDHNFSFKKGEKHSTCPECMWQHMGAGSVYLLLLRSIITHD